MLDKETEKTGALSQEEIDQLLSGVTEVVDMKEKSIVVIVHAKTIDKISINIKGNKKNWKSEEIKKFSEQPRIQETLRELKGPSGWKAMEVMIDEIEKIIEPVQYTKELNIEPTNHSLEEGKNE